MTSFESKKNTVFYVVRKRDKRFTLIVQVSKHEDNFENKYKDLFIVYTI